MKMVHHTGCRVALDFSAAHALIVWGLLCVKMLLTLVLGHCSDEDDDDDSEQRSRRVYDESFGIGRRARLWG